MYSGALIKDVSNLVDELTYINYAHNRNISSISPERWATVYGATSAAMEERYQREMRHTISDGVNRANEAAYNASCDFGGEV